MQMSRPGAKFGPLSAKAGTDVPPVEARMPVLDASELFADIHNRMPVILASSDYARWLSGEEDPRVQFVQHDEEPGRDS
jgi:hypothetical protein